MSRVFITGITGTLGTELARLHKQLGDEVFGCARSEARAAEWLRAGGVGTLYIRDARYAERMLRMLGGVDRLYHCSAVKHIDLCEQNIEDAVEQNINITADVVQACADWDVPLVHVSTDKAMDPRGVYGATKLIAERLALQRGAAVVRLGNLIGSSGSVFHLWAKGGRRITHPDMTRFFIPTHRAASYLSTAKPGLFVPPMFSARMGDVAAAIGGDFEVVGLRLGETMHQWIDDKMSSEHAVRWNTQELLREAGIIERAPETLS